MVDEFQDTNLCQYFIIRKLCSMWENICVVGDDAQSIYGFRGADITNILNFERDYPDLKIFKLEQNYRSTQTIVEAANTVIQKNKAQLPKTVWTANEEGNLIELIKAVSDNEEGRLVASSIFEEKMQHQLKFSDFVILYRTNKIACHGRSTAQNEHQIQVVGGLSFTNEKKSKICWPICVSPSIKMMTSLRRIINLPCGIGDTTVDKLVWPRTIMAFPFGMCCKTPRHL